jgi:hypothetical protein
MGLYDKAEPLYIQALLIRKKALGENHPDYAQSLNNLALLYKSTGAYDKAEPLYQQALLIRKKALGENHPDYATSLNNLAGLYDSMGTYDKAEPFCTPMPIQKNAISLNNQGDRELHTVTDHTDIESRKNPILISANESSDNVHFSVAGPKSANPGSNFLLTFWAYLNSQRDEVLKRIYDSHSRENTKIHYKGPVKIERETLITLFVEIDDLILTQNIASIFWTSEITSESFLVSVPEKVSIGTKIGKISVLVEGIEISKILFSLEITNSSTPTQSLPVDVIFHQKAFASYSSKDAKEVLSRIQAMEIVAPWLKVYIDFDGIRAGQYWKEELKKSISNMDVFYLFWSENAAKSDWVRREWQCALNSRGLDYIQPVPLVNPDKVPPPPELSLKQFKDKWSCYIEWVNSSRII